MRPHLPVNTPSLTASIVTAVLRVALLLTLIGAGWNIYSNLPNDGPEAQAGNGNTGGAATALLIVLRVAPDDGGVARNIPIEVYPVDIAAVRHDFLFSERRPGMRFDDFLAQRMNGRSPVEAQLDQNGQATVMVPPGKWWIHATLGGAENVEWRLPINVSGRKQTIELTPENAYARTKSF